jgi:hypothetical protein
MLGFCSWTEVVVDMRRPEMCRDGDICKRKSNIYGGGPCFDPLLEGGCGWIAWEAQKHDMPGWQKQCLPRLANRRRKPLDMFHVRIGEILLANMERKFLWFSS